MGRNGRTPSGIVVTEEPQSEILELSGLFTAPFKKGKSKSQLISESLSCVPLTPRRVPAAIAQRPSGKGRVIGLKLAH